VTGIQDRALGFLKLGQSQDEVYPGQQQDPFLTIPENSGEQKTINHVLDGSRLLYLVVAFSYRDSTTPQDAYRISESCEYFTRTLQSGRARGRNGTSLEKLEPAAPR